MERFGDGEEEEEGRGMPGVLRGGEEEGSGVHLTIMLVEEGAGD